MQTRRALAFSFIDRYAALVLNVLSSMAISRLLTPAEIGVFSVTMVLLTFISAMRDFGAGQYLVQERELTRERIRGVWTVLLGSGCLFALVVLLAAAPVAAFYGDARMKTIMFVIAFNFAINPFGSLTYAWLIREMRFDVLARMRFLSVLLGTAVSVGLAWRGVGPISLAYGSLATTVVNASIAARYRPGHFPWRPGFGEVRRVFGFGSKISANSLLGVVGSGAPEMVLGKAQSLASAAQYSRANGLATMFHRMFTDAIMSVAMPMFSREMRGAGRIDDTFVLTAAYVTAIGWSFYAGLMLLAHPTIRLLYGDQWDAAVTATRWLSAALFSGLPATLCASALMACGAATAVVRTTAISIVVQIALALALAAFGLDAVAAGMLPAHAFGAALWLRTSRAVVGFRWRALGAALARSLAVAAVTSLAPLASVLLFGLAPERPWPSLALALPLGCALFVLGVRLAHHPLQREVGKLGAWLRPRR